MAEKKNKPDKITRISNAAEPQTPPTLAEMGNLGVLTPRARPTVTIGSTEKIQTGCGTLYLTMNVDEMGLCEIFCWLGHAGGCPSAMLEGITRLISAALRSGISPDTVIKYLKGIRCPNSTYEKGRQYLSCLDAIAKTLERTVYGIDDKSIKAPHDPNEPEPVSQ